MRNRIPLSEAIARKLSCTGFTRAEMKHFQARFSRERMFELLSPLLPKLHPLSLSPDQAAYHSDRAFGVSAAVIEIRL
jgi:hypothetical protein